jgi:hypothetical protein
MDKRLRIVTVVSLLAAGVGVAWAFSPFSSSPEVVEVGPDEACVKESGKLKCRWDGDCVKRGNKCYSCIKDYHWSDEMDTCYSCPSGGSPQKQPDGTFECK